LRLGRTLTANRHRNHRHSQNTGGQNARQMIHLREIVGDDREDAILAVARMGEGRGGEAESC
jgi:hypothetical protein